MKDIHIIILSTAQSKEFETIMRANKIGVTIHGHAIQRCSLPSSETMRITIWFCVLNAVTKMLATQILPYMDGIIVHYVDTPLSVVQTAAWVKICERHATIDVHKIQILTCTQRKILPTIGEYAHVRGTIMNSILCLVNSSP